ncbi:activated RNA polymerase II transcriptional coactivator p15 [Ceratina calcarata]|uniref:Activated RNA polymerase II transcriptional coactivator p15 n=1 Tax=Ceratina calcarata TaxID=156304 RepID=A0AAJ7JAD2_9HYME|nr:activated RNA polymerase II transcriptional coactivator p15 [Ceratina calcarata]
MPKSKEYVDSTDDSSNEEEEVKPSKQKKREPEEKEEKMAKKKKREPEEKEEKTAKKAKKQSGDDEDDSWDLGNNRKVMVRDFKGKLLVDIREMYFDNAGNTKPGKKGIALTMPQWRKLLDIIEDVDEAVKSKA